ncbi:MAG: hypothetical protein VW338_10980, partial [Rhodospirillaceae bacterium]
MVLSSFLPHRPSRATMNCAGTDLAGQAALASKNRLGKFVSIPFYGEESTLVFNGLKKVTKQKRLSRRYF